MRQWIKNLLGPRPTITRARFRPGLEALEDRFVPSVSALADLAAPGPAVQAAVPMDSSRLLVLFHEALGPGAGNPGHYHVRNEDVVGVRVSNDRLGVVLTTTPRGAGTYQLTLTGLRA